eukprot:9497313-Alexandrium_andersonii.AAC.1
MAWMFAPAVAIASPLALHLHMLCWLCLVLFASCARCLGCAMVLFAAHRLCDVGRARCLRLHAAGCTLVASAA